MTKQCICGRSATYPYCDNTHSVKHRVIKNFNAKSFKYLQNEENNKVVELSGFISRQMSDDLIKSFKESASWEDVGFINTKTLMDISPNLAIHEDWNNIEESTKKAIEIIFNKKAKLQVMYVQKWNNGAEGVRHSDTYNFDKTPGNITYKIATTLFLHKDFTGGEVQFYNKEMLLNPKQGSIYVFNGGLNEHEILKVKSGTRYTIVSFWDYEDSEYTKEEIKAMERSQESWSRYIKEIK